MKREGLSFVPRIHDDAGVGETHAGARMAFQRGDTCLQEIRLGEVVRGRQVNESSPGVLEARLQGCGHTAVACAPHDRDALIVAGPFAHRGFDRFVGAAFSSLSMIA